MIFAAETRWPEAAVLIAMFVCVAIGWCALMWALARDGQRTGEIFDRHDPSPPQWSTSTRRVTDPDEVCTSPTCEVHGYHLITDHQPPAGPWAEGGES